MTALATVQDPEIRRSITEIGMVKNVEVTGQDVLVEIYLTVSGCPLKEERNLKNYLEARPKKILLQRRRI
jgi:metal-sulfur cluster biosynthetic enzyme